MSAQVSACCGAPLRVAGNTTQHYVCGRCAKPCDATVPTGPPREHNCRFEYCTAPTGECENPE